MGAYFVLNITFNNWLSSFIRELTNTFPIMKHVYNKTSKPGRRVWRQTE